MATIAPANAVAEKAAVYTCALRFFIFMFSILLLPLAGRADPSS